MLAVARRPFDRDADLPGRAEVDPARPPARPAGRRDRSRRRWPSWRRRWARNNVLKSFIGAGYHGTPCAAGHPAQSVREPGLVHRLHALPGRDQPGPAGDAVQFPDAGHRTHRPAGRVRLAARRGDGGRRSRRHRLCAIIATSATASRSPASCIRRSSTWCGPAPSRSASRSTATTIDDQHRGAARALAGYLRRLSASIGAAIEKAKAAGALVIFVADPLALTLTEPPAALGADIAVGSMQRFGVPMGFGGPHAAYCAVSDKLTRLMPGRLVGQSVDAHGPARLPPCAADARAAHPPRQGDLQHLHRAGAARQHGRPPMPSGTARRACRRSPRACMALPARLRRGAESRRLSRRRRTAASTRSRSR